MIYTNFAALREKVAGFASPKRMAVAAAADSHTLEAAMEAGEQGFCKPILIGDKQKILEILEQEGAPEIPPIHDEPDAEKASALAVRLVREGTADFLMKGMVDTKILLKAVVNKDSGLGTGKIMSHFSLLEVPSYHKLLSVVDAGMVPYPTLEQKKAIIDNTVGALRMMGYSRPKVGVLTCVEKVNPKMPETVEARALQEMAASGELEECIVEGPISYDCAISAEIAAVKGYESQVAGDVDILLAPNIHAANIMSKMLTCTCGATMAGVIVGASCPIVLTSRGASAEEKLLSILLSAAVSN